jgi:HEAT repeat protein
MNKTRTYLRCGVIRFVALALLLANVSGCALWSHGARGGEDAATRAKVSELLALGATGYDKGVDAKVDMAVEGLSGLGDKAVPPLSAALSDPDENVRLVAVQALAAIGTPAVAPPLIVALDDSNDDVRTEAVRALGKERVREAVQPLMRRVQTDPVGAVRYESLEALGEIGDPAARPLLLDGTHDANRYVRMWSMGALCTMHDEQAPELAVKLARDPEVYVRRHVIRACADALDSPSGHEVLIDLGLSDDIDTAFLARQVLNGYRQTSPDSKTLTEEMRAAARRALKNARTSTQSVNATFALGELADPAAVDGLIAALAGNRNFALRAFAARHLGEIGDRRAVPALIKALGDPQGVVVASAYTALQQFAKNGDARARASIESYAQKRRSPPPGQ